MDKAHQLRCNCTRATENDTIL